MKEKLRVLIEKILKKLAVRILKKHRPEIIGITGTVGKTSVKEAVNYLLSKKYDVYAPGGSYNSAIGVPLAIIQAENPRQIYNIFSWVIIFVKAIARLWDKNYPKILILEMGVDKPKDMEYLTSFIKPKISVITAITPVHMANFPSIKELEKEKLEILNATQELAIINEDQVSIKKSPVPVLPYGKKGEISYKVEKISVNGMVFKINLGKHTAEFKTKTVGEHSIYNILATVGVGYKYGFTIDEMATLFRDFRAYKGRMNPLAGAKESFIIDDSYNSSPESVKAAILTVDNFSGRKILALGSMNELGKMSEEAHREIGSLAFNVADVLITVGDEANHFIAGEALKRGMGIDNVHSFVDSKDAGIYLKTILKEGDIVLAKGSQNKIFMEELVKQILKNKNDVKYLVRQDRFWAKKKLI